MDNGFFWRIGKKEKKRRGNCETGRANFGISRSPTSLSPQKSLNVLSPTPHFPFPFMLFVPFLLLSFFSFSADRNCLLKQWGGKGNTHKKDHTVRKNERNREFPHKKREGKGKEKLVVNLDPFVHISSSWLKAFFYKQGFFCRRLNQSCFSSPFPLMHCYVHIFAKKCASPPHPSCSI